MSYGYTAGRRSSITYPSGRSVNFGFDAMGQVASVSVAGSAVLAAVKYQPFGPVNHWMWANGQVMERVFDEDGQLETYTSGPSTSTYGPLEQVFSYDPMA